MKSLALLLIFTVSAFAQGLDAGLLKSRSSSLLDKLSGYWRLEEASGTRYDRSINANHLSATGTPGQDTGKSGFCVNLTNGANQVLSIPSNSSLQVPSTDFEVTFWIKLAQTNTTRVCVAKSNSSGTVMEWATYLTNTKMTFQVKDSTGAFPTAQPSTLLIVDTWYFVDAYYDKAGKTVNLSLNNGTATSVAATNSINSAAADFTIGAFSGSSGSMAGLIDEVGYWKRLLTPGERAILYNNGTPGTHPQFHP